VPHICAPCSQLPSTSTRGWQQWCHHYHQQQGAERGGQGLPVPVVLPEGGGSEVYNYCLVDVQLPGGGQLPRVPGLALCWPRPSTSMCIARMLSPPAAAAVTPPPPPPHSSPCSCTRSWTAQPPQCAWTLRSHPCSRWVPPWFLKASSCSTSVLCMLSVLHDTRVLLNSRTRVRPHHATHAAGVLV
jgi:hypothetical protein